MAGRFQFRSTSPKPTVWVDFPDVSAALLEQAIELAIPGFEAAMREGLVQITEQARSQWPVATGRSRAGLSTAVGYDPTTGRISGRIFNTAQVRGRGYWQFIFSSQGILDAQQPIQVLVRQPVRDLKEKLKRQFPGVFRRKVKPRKLRFAGRVLDG